MIENNQNTLRIIKYNHESRFKELIRSGSVPTEAVEPNMKEINS